MATPKQPLIAAVDLDGTILSYDGWKGPSHFGKPLPGIIDELGKLKQAGWAIVIWTCRASDYALRAHLEKHQVPYDYINKHPWQPTGTSHKIYADVYIDDRALRFEGDTEGLAKRIQDHKASWSDKTAESLMEDRSSVSEVDENERRFRMSQLLLGKTAVPRTR